MGAWLDEVMFEFREGIPARTHKVTLCVVIRSKSCSDMARKARQSRCSDIT